MVGVVFSSFFQGDFFIFPKKQGRKKVYRRLLYILYFSKKKKKNKKIYLYRRPILRQPIKGRIFAANVKVLIGSDRWLLPVAGGLFYFALKNAFLGGFKPFSLLSYIIYHPTKENVLNRIFGKNNFFVILMIKLFSLWKSTS